jgi:hypothetical protein
MIEFFHDDFFTLPDKMKQECIRVSKQIESIIIQHPYFPFDPTPSGGYARSVELEIEYEEPAKHEFHGFDSNVRIMPNEVYHQRFRKDGILDYAFVEDLVENCRDSFSLTAISDDILWHETGYWSILYADGQYAGIGLNALKSAFETTKGGKIAWCAANRDSIVTIQGDCIKNSIIDVDMYTTNAFLPFTEIADVFRSGLSRIGCCNCVREDLILESAMHSKYSFGRQFSLQPRAFVMMESYPVLVCINNPAKQTPRVPQVLSKLDLLIGATMGGFVENNCSSNRRFSLRVENWILGDINLYQFYFVQEMSYSNLLKAIGLTNASFIPKSKQEKYLTS